MGVNPELPGVNMYITTCLHGVDLRFTPRCYLCKPYGGQAMTDSKRTETT